MNIIKKILIKIIPNNILKIYGVNKIILFKYGYLRSIKNKIPVDKNNEVIPWYTYPAIEYINQINLKDKTIFEYGTGNSSLYFAKKAKRVISVEDNKEWFEKINKNNTTNLKIFFEEEKNNYLNSIKKTNEKFDIIVIDANYRLECCHKIKNSLKEDGIVILDNSDRHPDCASYLRDELGLIEMDFHGFGPINCYTWTTSIFVSKNFNPKKQKGLHPTSPIGGIE